MNHQLQQPIRPLAKTTFYFIISLCLVLLTSFGSRPNNDSLPKTLTRTSALVDGRIVETTVILLDGNTSREELIYTCNFLAKENVQLIFDKLSIGRSFLGLVGKQRIRVAEGMIQLPNGKSQRFKAGGITSFRYLKIQYVKSEAPEQSRIEMVEKVG